MTGDVAVKMVVCSVIVEVSVAVFVMVSVAVTVSVAVAVSKTVRGTCWGEDLLVNRMIAGRAGRDSQ